MQVPIHVVVLAAGKGTRMRTDLPKVLHRAAGRTLIDWVLEAVSTVEPARTVVVVGHGAEAVAATLPPGVDVCLQEPQLGTGHAVQAALATLDGIAPDDTVIVCYGDGPLILPALVSGLAGRSPGEAVRMVTVDVADPGGYGRILRDGAGSVVGVVEERDASPDQLALTEINTGLYAFRAGDLIEAIGRVEAANAQGEHYLTDVVRILAAGGKTVTTMDADPVEVAGINSHDQLASAESVLRQRINACLMEAGVWMQDPGRTYVDAGVEVEAGARLYAGVHLEGATAVAADAEVGPDTLVRDGRIGRGAHVWYSVVRGAEIGEEAEVGPFASLRPGTVVGRRAKVGTFVETKATTLAEGAKAPHLSYLGDATVGRGANIGAGTITCNYDGYDKHRTVIGDGAFIGSDTMLVAPVTIGERAVTGAGSVITEDVEDGALAVERSPQNQVPGYADRRAARRRVEEADQST